MQKIIDIARREYLETVKTRAFVLGLLMTPAIIIAVIYFSSKMDPRKQQRDPITVGVTDLTEQLKGRLEKVIDQHNQNFPGSQVFIQHLDCEDPNLAEEAGKNQLRQGKVKVFAVVNPDVFKGSGGIRVFTHNPKPSHVNPQARRVEWTGLDSFSGGSGSGIPFSMATRRSLCCRSFFRPSTMIATTATANVPKIATIGIMTAMCCGSMFANMSKPLSHSNRLIR